MEKKPINKIPKGMGYITKYQFEMIANAADLLSAMTGTMDEDYNWDLGRTVKAIDRMLKKNNLKRVYK